MRTREQGSVLFAGVLVMIATLVIIQLWLLTAALEALLPHSYDVVDPGRDRVLRSLRGQRPAPALRDQVRRGGPKRPLNG